MRTINIDLVKAIRSNSNFGMFCFKRFMSELDELLFAAYIADDPDADPYTDAVFVDVDENMNVVSSWYYGDIDWDTGEFLDPDAVEEHNVPLAKVFEAFKHYCEEFPTRFKDKRGS